MGVLGVRDPGTDADANCFEIDTFLKLRHADLWIMYLLIYLKALPSGH